MKKYTAILLALGMCVGMSGAWGMGRKPAQSVHHDDAKYQDDSDGDTGLPWDYCQDGESTLGPIQTLLDWIKNNMIGKKKTGISKNLGKKEDKKEVESDDDDLQWQC